MQNFSIRDNSINYYKPSAIYCLHNRIDARAADLARVCFSSDTFDWYEFQQYLRKELISPLIHSSLESTEIIPSELSEIVQKDYLKNAWINDRRMAELDQVLTRFDAEGISTVLLKGAALIASIYDKKGLRPMVDLDLLIREADLTRAEEVLMSCGYEKSIASIFPPGFQTEVIYHKPGPTTWIIELHISLFCPPHQLTQDQLNWFWSKSVRVVNEGKKFCIFNPTAQLLHLCAHMWLHHGGGKLIWEYDIDLLIRKCSDVIDWNELIAVGEDFELLLPLQKVLPEMAETWRSPIPREVCLMLAEKKPSSREKRKFLQFFESDQNYPLTFISVIMSYPDWRSRLHYARIILFPSKQHIQERYQVRHPLLIPYFYIYRLVSRIIQQIGRLFSSFGKH